MVYILGKIGHEIINRTRAKDGGASTWQFKMRAWIGREDNRWILVTESRQRKLRTPSFISLIWSGNQWDFVEAGWGYWTALIEMICTFKVMINVIFERWLLIVSFGIYFFLSRNCCINESKLSNWMQSTLIGLTFHFFRGFIYPSLSILSIANLIR